MSHQSCLRAVCAVLALLLPLAAFGQMPVCPDVQEGEPFVNPPELRAAEGASALTTTLDAQEQWFCIPFQKNPDGTWKTQPLKLRTYVYPDPKTGQPAFGLPGPTLRVRKADGTLPGQGLNIRLENSLEFPTDGKCRSACSASTTCNCDPAAVDALIKKCAASATSDCCCIINCTQKPPNCFHGDNVTNLHFHGSHASPQAPQDFVLLDLYPPKPRGANTVEHGSHGSNSVIAYGHYDYKVQPLDELQAEGSHWYHPHKHGSVGVQVANGMAGALIIDGPFDKEMEKYYNPETGDKVIVIQQVTSAEPLFQQSTPAAQILVNGKVKPRIKIAPGEIQRWRFVNATMSSRTLLQITLPPGLTFRQIAMDGVRFSPTNYKCQPLINFDTANPSFPCNSGPFTDPKLRLAPGNRADFLVQGPLVETPKNGPGLEVQRKLIEIAGSEGGQRLLLVQQDEKLAPGEAEPPLFTVDVDDGIEGNDDAPKTLKAGALTLPDTLPPMPPFLTNITDQEVAGNPPVQMTFQQVIAGTSKLWPYSRSPLSEFKIDGRQFCATCANVTTRVETAAEWTVRNATVLPHPFHIHTNPFQLTSFKGARVTANGAEPIWMDTIALATATVSPASPPANPADPVNITPANVVFRQRYRQFTGQYVLHCHFLGHEDRGMMFSVQTVCKERPEFYGKAGIPIPECTGELIKALGPCPTPPACPAPTASSEGGH